MLDADETTNFELFRDCLSPIIVEKFAVEPRKAAAKRKSGHGRKRSHAVKADVPAEDENKDAGELAEELAEFVDYIAPEVFLCLPDELRTLTYSSYTNSKLLQELYTPQLSSSSAATILQTLDPSVTDSLIAYNLLPSSSSSDSITAADLLQAPLDAYLATLTTAPPAPSQTRDLATGCEICEREHIPLTYHHLIPRFVHEKAVKRGWHTRDQLNNVAWLCRACHSFVHHVASHEELARNWYTVELLLGRDDVRRFAGWVGRVRWKSR